MNRYIFLFLIAAFSLLLHAKCVAQNNIVYGAGISYTNGVPTFVPPSKSARVAIDTVTSKWYEYATPGGWRWAGDRIQNISGCAVPAYVPTKGQSRLVLNSCTPAQNGSGPELYQYQGSVWVRLNAGSSYTAGTGIDITGTLISNTGDLSNTNELQTLSIDGSDITLSNGGGTVSIPGGSGGDGIYGGSGTVPSGTAVGLTDAIYFEAFNGEPILTIQNTDGVFLKNTNSTKNLSVSNSGIVVTDTEETKTGIIYADDYSDALLINDRSLADVGMVKKLSNARPYKVYTATLTYDQGTSTISAAILENTLSGNPTWNEVSPGIYNCYLESEFVKSKTVVFCNTMYFDTSTGDIFFISATRANDSIELSASGGHVMSDWLGALTNMNGPLFQIEIRVYD